MTQNDPARPFPQSEEVPTSRVSQVTRRLYDIHPDLGRMYEGATHVLKDELNPARGYHAAHSLREVMGRLPEYLKIEKRKPCRDNWGRLFGCDPNDPVVNEWHRIQNRLLGWPHLPGPNREGPDPRRVAELAHECTELLWKYSGPYSDAANDLDKFLLVENPTPEQVSYVKGFFSSQKRRIYFYRELKHGGWLQPLRDAGFFKNPPPDQNHEGIFRPVYWPESGYLARMAKKDSSLVCDIVLNNLPTTANPYIYLDLLDAAIAMPPTESVKLLGKLCNKTAGRLPFSAPEKLAQLLESWSEAGFQSDVHALAWFLFDVSASAVVDSENTPRPHPVIRMDPRDYRTCLRRYTTIHGDAPPEGLVSFLITLLRRALSHSDRTSPDDHSFIWRSSIQDHKDDFGHDQPLHILISSLRDAGILYAHSCPSDQLPALFKKMEKEGWHIFERISLHVMAQVPDRCEKFLAARILDIGHYDRSHFRYEYFQLVKNGFSFLNQGNQESFLKLIEQGPQNDRGIEGRKRYWQLERLSLVKSHLPAEWDGLYKNLVAEFGEPTEYLGRQSSVRFGAYGETSPISKQELIAMTTDELLSALRITEFSGKWDEPSAEGLANVLEECAKEKPERFAGIAQLFKEIQPSYIGAMIRGLKSAWTESRNFSLSNLLSLFEALATPNEDGSEWLKQEMAQFLNVILKGHLIESEHSEQIWRFLSNLFKSSPPDSAIVSTEKEQIDISDAVMNASRTARGDATRAIMSFMYWRAQNLGWDKIETAKNHSMKQIPEITKLLEEYLAGDFYADVHPTIGSNLDLLLWIDEKWVIHHLSQIFPDDPNKIIRDLAWCGYLNRQVVRTDAVRVFEHQYRRAIEEIIDVENDVDFPDKDQTCTSHVINYYLSGNIKIEDRTSLLARLLEKAPSRMMRRVFEDFRRSLDEHDPGPEILERFRLFIEWRLAKLEKSNSQSASSEITGLAALICSKSFPPDWTAKYLLSALTEIDGKMDSDYWVVERMRELAEVGHISEVLEGFVLLTKGTKNDWDINSWETELHAVFELAVASNDLEIRSLAKKLADKLGDRGFDEYRKLLLKT